MLGQWGSTTERGLLPRVLEGLFAAIQGKEEVHCTVSYHEIYNERIRDLLLPADEQRNCQVHFHPSVGVSVFELTEAAVASIEDVMRLVDYGAKMRTVAQTSLNSRSSRSHTIFTARFECMEKAGLSRIGQVQIVDLAGREAESNVHRDHTDRLVELSFINRSLFHLSHCIERLTGNKKNLDWYAYRNSKLTMILSHSLRGNSRTAMIATISPSAAFVEDTLSTLQLASSIKTVQTQSTVNTVDRADAIQELQDEIGRLKGDLHRAREDPAELQIQLMQMQALCEHYRASWAEAVRTSSAQDKTRQQDLARLGLGDAA